MYTRHNFEMLEVFTFTNSLIVELQNENENENQDLGK